MEENTKKNDKRVSIVEDDEDRWLRVDKIDKKAFRKGLNDSFWLGVFAACFPALIVFIFLEQISDSRLNAFFVPLIGVLLTGIYAVLYYRRNNNLLSPFCARLGKTDFKL